MKDEHKGYANVKDRLVYIAVALAIVNTFLNVWVMSDVFELWKVAEDMYDKVTFVADAVNELQDVVNENKNSIESLQSDYAKLYNEYRVLASKYHDMDDSLRELNNRIDSIEEIVTKRVRDKFKVYSYYDIQRIAREGYASIKTRDEIQDILDEYFSDKDYTVYYWFYDERYLAYDYDILKKILLEINWFMKHNEYLEEYYDCDDYATVTMGIIRNNLPGAACMIMAISYKSYEYGHLQVLCIAKDGRIIFYDPTNGEFDILDEYDISEMLVFG